MLKKYGHLIIWILVFQLIGYSLGRMTQSNLQGWYDHLYKSTLTPPPMVFSIVWSILYTTLAISAWYLWWNRNNVRAKKAFNLFSIQMVLNWAWSPLFFKYHQISSSFLCIIIIAILTLKIILLTRKEFKFNSWILIPYFLWLLFAGYLNAVIFFLN